MSIKVLIVDDSALMRKVLGNIVQEIEGLDLIDTARNGKDALKIMERIKPDIVTLDVEMPVLNGIDTLEKIKSTYDIPVIMLSAKSNQKTTIQALELGAVDFIEKPVNIQQNWALFKDDLEKRIKAHFIEQKPIAKQALKKSTIDIQKTKAIEAIVIGASTGGPRALLSIIRTFPKNLRVPVFIVQHMPAAFTASFAKRLDTSSNVDVMEVVEGQKIEPGKVYLAPGGKHMVIENNRLLLNEELKIHGVRPAVDFLFQSAAQRYQNHLIGVILTGMGNDGVEGCRHVKEAGGYVITQDKESSIVYGMPRNAAEKGYSDRIANLTEISDMLNRMVG